MRKIIYLIPLFIFGCKSATTVSDKVITSNEVKKASYEFNYRVEERNVSQTLKTLTSDAFEGREAGTEGINKAGAYLEQLLVQYKVQPYFQSYRDTLSNFKKNTFNIVGVIEGNDPVLKNEFIVLGAHYDHIGVSKEGINGDKINNGANDDASGVTAVAEIARYFGEHKSNKRSILVVFFTAEEVGLLGSEHLSEKLKKRGFNLYSMLNFEMIGVPMRADYTAYITGFSKSTMATKLNDYAGKKLVGYFPMEFQYQLFSRSDNYPFFKQFNVPCQTVCTFDFENYPYYHHVDDEFELMDTKHMTSFIQDVLPVVEQMANSATKEIVLK